MPTDKIAAVLAAVCKWRRLGVNGRPSHGQAARCPCVGSFDHLVGTQKERFRDRQSECLRGLKIDNQLEFGRHLYGKLARLSSAENPSTQGAARRNDSMLSCP